MASAFGVALGSIVSGREEIIDTDVSSELADSFLEYSMSVIVARALPDARDGLKPVHRRILWSMHQQGIRPSTPYKKCARVVGDVIGRYHPHGDSAVYEALVRLAQPWSMRLPLVDGHGNFGSLDDGPAAMRYTECRLASASMPMVEELGEDTVDMRPNYDGTESEPSVMPAAFPNLLVNGGTGIAVGMATSMPPHNLVEVVAGLQALLENPKMSLSEMLKFIPGPDLPTGGSIVGAEGFMEAYATGRGSFKMRATTEVVNVSPRRQGIEVTELPFTVGPEKVVARIKELVGDKKLQGISDVKDFSDRKTGLRLVIEVKTGFNPNAVLSELLRLTPLEESFGINNVALVDGQPRTLGLLDLCRVFLEHRQTVVRRRTEFRLRKAQARAHIVEGLLVALASIDEVVALIRSSKDAATARTKLVKRFDLSDVQADAILEMTLRRLTSLEVGKLKDELRELKKAISEFEKILASPAQLRKVISSELEAISSTFGSPRRTKLVTGVPELTVSDSLEVPDDPCLVTLASTGHVARLSRDPHKGKVGKGDVLSSLVDTSLHSYIGAISAGGVLSRVRALEVPESSAKVKAQELFGASDSLIALLDCRPGRLVTLVTAAGMVKRLRTDDLPKVLDPKSVVSLAPGDSVVAAVSHEMTADEGELVIVSSAGQLLRFPASSVSPKGLGAGPMAGMKLSDGARVIAANWVSAQSVNEALVVCVSDSGAVKVSALSEFPAKGRGGGGVRAMSWRKGESYLQAAAVGGYPWVGLAASGAVVPLPGELLKRDASGVPCAQPVAAIGYSRFVPASS